MDGGVIYDFQSSKRTSVASHVLFIYDTLLCLDREYEYVWRARWTFGKGLYVVTRYLPLIANSWIIFSPYTLGTNPSRKFCRVTGLLEGYSGLIAVTVAQATMAIRTNALYREFWWAKWLLAIIFALAIGANTLLYSLHLPAFNYHSRPPLGILTGCIPDLRCQSCDVFTRWWWLPPVVFESLVFLMTLVDAAIHVKLQARTRILDVLYRDGIMYFGFILSAELAQLILWNTARVSKFPIFYGYTRSLQAMLSCRLFLNLRGVLTKPSQFVVGQNNAHNTLPLTSIAFVPGPTHSTAVTIPATAHQAVSSTNRSS